MSLEVDHRDNLPIPYQPQSEHYGSQNGKESYAYSAVDHAPIPSAPTQQRNTKTVLLLSIALTVMTILAVVAAAVGGSKAVKWKNQ